MDTLSVRSNRFSVSINEASGEIPHQSEALVRYFLLTSYPTLGLAVNALAHCRITLPMVSGCDSIQTSEPSGIIKPTRKGGELMADIRVDVRKELIDWAFEITDLSPESQHKVLQDNK